MVIRKSWKMGRGSRKPTHSPSFSPHGLHHTLTHNFCTYEQTEKNSHQPEPALKKQTLRSGLGTALPVPKTSLDLTPPQS